jgi:RNA-binding protein 25
LVKADEKTRARLDQYEASRVKNEVSSSSPFLEPSQLTPSFAQQTTEFLLRAKDELTAIIDRMNSGDIPSTSTLSSNATPSSSRPTERTLSHLQDLAPEDLPDSSREIITSEIALFRDRAAKRAAEKKEMEAQLEARRYGAGGQGGGGPTVNGRSQGTGWGPRGGQHQADPQSYNKPIGFIAAGGEADKSEAVVEAPVPEIDDAQRERERAEKAHREDEFLFRDVS